MENYFKMNMTAQEVNAISNLGLAHIGDGVFELLCRSYLCAGGGKKVSDLHKATIAMVKYDLNDYEGLKMAEEWRITI